MKILDLLEDLSELHLQYHDTLNPKLWSETKEGYALDDAVRAKLLEIGHRFIETLKLPDSVIRDIVVTGSNVNYNWTPLSDLDVHVLLHKKALSGCESCKVDVEDCLLAKKTLWNEQHDIHVRGIPVELYVTKEAAKLVKDAGTYSLLNDRWLQQPAMQELAVSSEQVKAKVDELSHEVDALIKNRADDEAVKQVMDKIWGLRKAGLKKHGEFSVENLAFKSLRNGGYVDKLKRYASKHEDEELSLP